jgi:hypothetical protein
MERKVFRNVLLKGVISKQRALDLLGMELSVIVNIKGKDIIISRDDMEDINIDLYVDGENLGGELEELK